jgi:ankyrin repeat protein
LLLKSGKADVKSRDRDEQTLLSFAAAGGYEGVVKLLLETDQANIDQENYDGHTARDLATHNCHQAVVRLLREIRYKTGPKKQRIWELMSL